MDWDTTIALAYAAEQLFVAAQVLTSDLVSAEQGLLVAHARLEVLLDNQVFLPKRIRERVRRLRELYERNRATRLNPASASALARKTMNLLEEIRAVVAAEQQRLAAETPFC